MRVLITTVLVRTGQWRHVCDLVERLHAHGIQPRVAVQLRTHQRPQRVRAELLRSFRGTPFTVYRKARHLFSFARRYGAELIHAHSSHTYRTALQASRKLPVPLVVTLHGAVAWLERFPLTMRHAAQIIAVGPAQAGAVPNQYPAKVTIIPNGIDVHRFRPSSDGPPLDAPLRVLWYGRTSGRLSRGVVALDKALGLLRRAGHHIEGRMVGVAKGAAVRHLKAFGWLDDPLPHLQWSHIAFGHGRSLREAMACGNAGFLLGFGYGGLVTPSWFDSPSYAFGALPDYNLPAPDPDQIAREILRLDEERHRLYQLREEARLIAERIFDRDDMVRRTAQIYVRALMESGRSGTWDATLGAYLAKERQGDLEA